MMHHNESILQARRSDLMKDTVNENEKDRYISVKLNEKFLSEAVANKTVIKVSFLYE